MLEAIKQGLWGPGSKAIIVMQYDGKGVQVGEAKPKGAPGGMLDAVASPDGRRGRWNAQDGEPAPDHGASERMIVEG